MPSPLSKRAIWTDQGKRLTEAMEARGLDPAKLQRLAGLDYDTVRSALRGKREPRETTQYALFAALGVNRYWVISGTGERAATSAEIEEYLALARGTSSTDLVPVTTSSLGIDLWLTESDEGRRTKAGEREWLRKFPWLDSRARYHDILFSTALQLYRQMAASAPEARDSASLT